MILFIVRWNRVLYGLSELWMIEWRPDSNISWILILNDIGSDPEPGSWLTSSGRRHDTKITPWLPRQKPNMIQAAGARPELRHVDNHLWSQCPCHRRGPSDTRHEETIFSGELSHLSGGCLGTPGRVWRWGGLQRGTHFHLYSFMADFMGFLIIQVVVFGLVAVSPWCPGARMPGPGWSVPVFALLGGRTTDYRLHSAPPPLSPQLEHKYHISHSNLSPQE